MTARLDILTPMGLDLIVSPAPVPIVSGRISNTRIQSRRPSVVEDEVVEYEFESREELFEFVDSFVKLIEVNFGRQTKEIKYVISHWPVNEEIDPDDELVDWITEEEKFLVSFYKDLAVPETEDIEATNAYKKMEDLCIKYLKIFQKLRCEISMHDGDASPRTGKVYTSGEQLLESLEETT